MSKRAPRHWDRRPMTPFNSRSKSRKVWKRFLASASKDIVGDDIDRDPLLTEINSSFAYRGVLRGVKRQCTATYVGVGRARSFLETKWETEDMGVRKRKHAQQRAVCISESFANADTVADADDSKPNEDVERQQSAENNNAIDQNTPCLHSSPAQDDNTVPSTLNLPQALRKTVEEVASPVAGDTLLPFKASEDASGVSEDAANLEVIPSAIEESPEPEQGEVTFGAQVARATSPLRDMEDTPSTTTTIKNVVEETATPLTIPPSRRLFPRLEGDDEEFLSDFLSQAQAKRSAAKSAVLSKELGDSSVEHPVRSPTPRTREVLKVLDKISPSSPSEQKNQLKATFSLPAPNFSLSIDPEQSGAEQEEQEQEKSKTAEEGQQQPRVATPWRRSTRKTITRTQRHTPSVPNHIPVRRSNGTEFVFLQRSEEQQLSLTTKANTRRNRGDAQLPHLVLQAINAQEYVHSCSSNGEVDDPVSPRKSSKKRIRLVKTVTWDEKNLVQYEGKTYNNEEQNVEIRRESPPPQSTIYQSTRKESNKKQDTGNTSKSSRKSKSNKQADSTHHHSQPPKSPTVTRKVSKLGAASGNSFTSVLTTTAMSDTATTTAAAAAKIKSTRKIASTHPGTPIQRKKLTPKSPTTITFKVSENAAPNISTATTTRSTAKKFSGSCLPRHMGKTRV
ncbi:hypothetical protein ACO22_01267 [Paracoccidioides brasiliensis]|uniref:Uncharacterized protein n=1 Tax=Paracoccidioides brasiliensis TaxID=121759 RepID=A0A1D2JME3_PARBR|nr:hypothetical protein ACO22_01267 [Paracoccidioides brasiliensis]